MSGPSAEKDAGQRLDPWGCPLPPVEELTFCNFRAPTGLPCTSVKAHHIAAHFTSDGHLWPGAYVAGGSDA